MKVTVPATHCPAAGSLKVSPVAVACVRVSVFTQVLPDDGSWSVSWAVVPPAASLVLWSGEQQRTLAWRDLQDYVGERAQRGAVLKRGWPRRIERMEARLLERT